MVSFLVADEPLYVSPSGTGDGSQENPTNLTRALESGKSMILSDGIYQYDSIITLASGKTMQAAVGARPILTRSDNKPPAISLEADSVLDGVWFGGTKETETERAILMNDGATIKNCTIFGYYGGIAEGDNADHIIQDNLFVDCGTSPFYHDIYISKNHAVGGCVVSGNIHLGGGGYKHHLYNSQNGEYPSNVQIVGNFYADVVYAQAIYGRGHSITKNILWSTSDISANMQVSATYEWSNNILGLETARMAYYDESPDRVINGNVIVDGAPSEVASDPIGNNLSVWAEGDIVANLGKSSAEINAAVAALLASFGEAVATIHADETIAANVAILRGALGAWNA